MMADVKPFRALYYNEVKAPLGRVTAPPYDVISPEEREELYRKSEFNVVRVDFGKDEPSDDRRTNRYTRARLDLDRWIQEGVLLEDESPSFYLYEQSFMDPVTSQAKTRKALFVLLKLEEIGRGVVFAHEKTNPKPKEDRLRLLNETEANLSPVFGLYEDADSTVARILDSFRASNPFLETRPGFEARDRLWKITGELADSLARAFSAKSILLADGHHRYETALLHRDLKRAPGEDSCAYVMIALVAMEDPGLLVLPTHRLIRSFPGFDFARIQAELNRFFEFRRVSPRTLFNEVCRLKHGEKGFGLYRGEGDSWLLTLRSLDLLRPLMPAGRSRAWCELVVSILSYLVIEKILGLEGSQAEEILSYTKSEEEALSRVDSGECAAAFLLSPIAVAEIQKVSKLGELLPPKSTYFYPKLPSGLVFYRHKR
jgi:uncharacterized protein (DUF1015 family)